MNNTILEKKKRVSDQVLYALIQLSSFLSIFILLVIIGYILYRGIPREHYQEARADQA